MKNKNGDFMIRKILGMLKWVVVRGFQTTKKFCTYLMEPSIDEARLKEIREKHFDLIYKTNNFPRGL